MEEKKAWGGAGRGQGRKSIKSGEKTVALTAKVTEPQKAKYKRLGGPSWLRKVIDTTPE